MKIVPVLFALSLTACGSPVESLTGPVSLSIVGTVRDERTGDPVPAARVALVREGGVYPISGDVGADARGRFTLSSSVPRAECEGLRVSATVGDWPNAGVTPLPARSLRCTSRAQRIDITLRFEPF